MILLKCYWVKDLDFKGPLTDLSALSILLEFGEHDPGIRSRIFHPNKRTKESIGLVEVDGSFISAQKFVQCDSGWKESSFNSFQDYARWVMHSVSERIDQHSINLD